MLFFGTGLEYWNTDDVVRVSPARKGQWSGKERTVYDIDFRDGRSITVLDNTARQLFNAPIQSIPAQPGWKVITGYDENEAFIESVIAWAITFNGEIAPITIDGVNGGLDGALPVIRPDGCVQIPMGSTYESLSTYLAEKYPNG
tara:strand:+ start:323 stop:754 length:432 start_codon:yes stop_codon:yes gene_type:complete